MPSTRAQPANYATFATPQPAGTGNNENAPLLKSTAHPAGEDLAHSKVAESYHNSKEGSKQAWSSSVNGFAKENAGLLLVGASQIFFSSMNTSVQVLHTIDPPVSTMQIIFARMFITYVCSVVYMTCRGVPSPFIGPKGVRLLLAARGLFGFVGLFGLYYSLQYLSLSDATVLTFVAPLCTAISGAVFLGERFTLREALAGCVSLAGVVLIARPGFLFGNKNGLSLADQASAEHRLVAVGVALFGVVGATGAYTTIRAIGKRAHPMHAMVSFSGVSIIVSVTWMCATETSLVIPSRIDWLGLFVLVGVFGFGAQLFLTMGLQRESAGRATIAVYSQIVFATILERIFFHTAPTALSVIGTLLIVSSALFVALTKKKTPMVHDPESPTDVSITRSAPITTTEQI